MAEDSEALVDAIAAVMPPLLNGLEALGFVGRHLHPPRLKDLVLASAARGATLADAMARFRTVAWPQRLERFRALVEEAGSEAQAAFDGLRSAAEAPDGRLEAYRALRHVPRALEALYPLAGAMPVVSRFFLEPGAREDAALQARLKAGRTDVGLLHATNERHERGGFSLYVPESYEPSRPHPLVVAMHGGSGHGRAFLWSWVREARTRGLILVSPTAIGETWSLMQPELDSRNLDRILGYVREHWNVETTRLLLTGMSDGGTFSLLSGLLPNSPFTHLAPVAASFHPMMLSLSTPERLDGLPVYLVHGALDWMFPVAMAEQAEAALTEARARVSLRVVEDLSHTYPRDENAAMLDWFLG
jgi:phospholipase/carboxylesterase